MNHVIEAGVVGSEQVLLIIVVLLIFFGGKKIPELMKGLGKGVKEFKDATNGKDAEVETKEVKKEELKENVG